jgi:excisionase family DNA binding protein
MESQKIHFYQLNPEDFKKEILEEIKKELSALATEIKPKPETIWLTRNQTCEKLGVSLVTLYKWNKENILPAHKFGGSVRYNLEDIKVKLFNKKKAE